MRISEKVVYFWFIFGLFLVFSSSGTNVESSGAPGIGTAVQEQMRISSKSGLFFVYFCFFPVKAQFSKNSATRWICRISAGTTKPVVVFGLFLVYFWFCCVHA